jgi:hypothetical protein
MGTNYNNNCNFYIHFQAIGCKKMFVYKSMVRESGSGKKCALLVSEVHAKPNQKTILDRMVEWDSLYLGVTQNPD